MKSGFLDRLIERLDRMDPESLQSHFLRLVRERGLLETIFQSIQEGVLVIDGEGRLKYANRAAESLLGFNLESAEGRSVSRYLREIDWARVLKLDVTEWSKLITREIEILYPEHRFLSFYVVPVTEDGDEERAAVVILRDVTHDREQESSMLESERMNAIKLLAAGVAHEIGNPLNALNIHLQLLDRELGDLPPDAQQNLSELVEVARNEVSRLDLILTQFLRAIRPTQPDLKPLQLGELLEETLTLLKQELLDRKIEIEINSPPSLPKVPVDAGQLKQAFFNLIRNAYQAMPDGGVLRIRLSSSSQYVGVAFEDSGVGINADDFGRIFDPYHTTKADGSGLGLMIVQRIVQDHGGQIEVVSNPGEGTRFTILLPRVERAVRLLKAPRGAGVGGAASPFPFRDDPEDVADVYEGEDE